MWFAGTDVTAGGGRRRGSRSLSSSSTSLRPALKEKWVSLYEHIFALTSDVQRLKDDGFHGRQALQRFWDDLFLLKVRHACLSLFLFSLSFSLLFLSLSLFILSLFLFIVSLSLSLYSLSLSLSASLCL